MNATTWPNLILFMEPRKTRKFTEKFLSMVKYNFRFGQVLLRCHAFVCSANSFDSKIFGINKKLFLFVRRFLIQKHLENGFGGDFAKIYIADSSLHWWSRYYYHKRHSWKNRLKKRLNQPKHFVRAPVFISLMYNVLKAFIERTENPVRKELFAKTQNGFYFYLFGCRLVRKNIRAAKYPDSDVGNCDGKLRKPLKYNDFPFCSLPVAVACHSPFGNQKD